MDSKSSNILLPSLFNEMISNNFIPNTEIIMNISYYLRKRVKVKFNIKFILRMLFT